MMYQYRSDHDERLIYLTKNFFFKTQIIYHDETLLSHPINEDFLWYLTILPWLCINAVGLGSFLNRV